MKLKEMAKKDSEDKDVKDKKVHNLKNIIKI